MKILIFVLGILTFKCNSATQSSAFEKLFLINYIEPKKSSVSSTPILPPPLIKLKSINDYKVIELASISIILAKSNITETIPIEIYLSKNSILDSSDTLLKKHSIIANNENETIALTIPQSILNNTPIVKNYILIKSEKANTENLQTTFVIFPFGSIILNYTINGGAVNNQALSQTGIKERYYEFTVPENSSKLIFSAFKMTPGASNEGVSLLDFTESISPASLVNLTSVGASSNLYEIKKIDNPKAEKFWVRVGLETSSVALTHSFIASTETYATSNSLNFVASCFGGIGFTNICRDYESNFRIIPSDNITCEAGGATGSVYSALPCTSLNRVTRLLCTVNQNEGILIYNYYSPTHSSSATTTASLDRCFRLP